MRTLISALALNRQFTVVYLDFKSVSVHEQCQLLMYLPKDFRLTVVILFRQFLTRFLQSDWFLDVLKVRADVRQ